MDETRWSRRPEAGDEGGPKAPNPRVGPATHDGLLELLPHVLYVHDLVDGTTICTNEACHALLGYSAEQLRAMGDHLFSVLMHPEDLALYHQETAPRFAAARDRELVRSAFRLRHKDGAWRWLQASEQVCERAADGSPRRVFGVMHDIDEQKAAESALLESEVKFRDIVRNVPGVVYQLRIRPDGSSYFSYISPRATELLGLPIDPDRPEWEMGAQIPEDERGTFLESVGRAITERRAWEYEGRIQAQNGGMKWFRGLSLPVQLGEDLVFNGILSDITERKQAEQAIAAERERLAVTLRCIGDAVMTTDTMGMVVTFNRAAEVLTGHSHAVAVGRPLGEVLTLLREPGRRPWSSLVDEVLRDGAVTMDARAILVAKDGSERVVTGRGSEIRTSQGEIIGVALVINDMTERLRILETLQRTEKLESLGLLAGGIAHDFNNLLGGMFGYLTLARDRLRQGGRAEEFLESALATFERARSLTQQLLTFAKGGAPSKKTCSLGPVLRTNTQFALSGSNCGCLFEIEENLWSCDGDANQIGQVVDNLVINAKQAMPAGGTVRVAARNVGEDESRAHGAKAGRYVHFSVTDTGEGIPDGILGRVFDPFFTTKERGNGLGLATAHSIVARHGGAISVESSARGTTFHVLLPASFLEEGAAGELRPREHHGAGRVLVMDDEACIREVAERLLSSMGYEARTVADGTAALAAFVEAQHQGRPFDLVLLDLTIVGGMGGKETVAQLRRLHPTVPVVVSSGYSEDPILSNPRAYGFTDTLHKPYRKSDLAEVLARQLGPAARPG